MTQSREPNDRDIFTRMAQVEYRLTRIENTNVQLQETILQRRGFANAPGGYITDAFERVVERIDEVEDRLNARMDEQFAEVNTKLDIIIRGMTGMGQE
jgi:hypothetical protein